MHLMVFADVLELSAKFPHRSSVITSVSSLLMSVALDRRLEHDWKPPDPKMFVEVVRLPDDN